MKYEYNGVQIRPSVEIYHDSIPYLSGITLKEFFWTKSNAPKHGGSEIKRFTNISAICSP